MLPSPSQGILAIEIHEDDKKMDDILILLEDKK